MKSKILLLDTKFLKSRKIMRKRGNTFRTLWRSSQKINEIFRKTRLFDKSARSFEFFAREDTLS